MQYSITLLPALLKLTLYLLSPYGEFCVMSERDLFLPPVYTSAIAHFKICVNLALASWTLLLTPINNTVRQVMNVGPVE